MMGGMMGNMMGVKGGRASVCAIMTGHIEGRLGLRIALRGLRVTHVIGEAKYQY